MRALAVYNSSFLSLPFRLCFFFFCILYKKCGNPKYCKDNDALTCPMFKENKEIINCAISDFNDYMKHNQIEVWKSDLSKM